MRIFLAIRMFFYTLANYQKVEEFISPSTAKKPKEPVHEKVENDSHLQLLQQMQESGRLIDFLQEDISAYSDAQIGAVVRQVHSGCLSAIEELVTVRVVREEPEGTRIQVPKGYDPLELKIVGNIKGEPPFEGTLVHRGWRAHKKTLPGKRAAGKRDIIVPAEIEVK